MIVTKVNGKTVGTIKELAKAFEDVPEDGIHRIELNDYPKIIYVRDDISREVNRQLRQYGLASFNDWNRKRFPTLTFLKKQYCPRL